MIKIEGLSFSYADKTVLKEIDISADKGDLLAVLGPNGVGKTTLISILTGKLEVQSGKVELCDIDIKDGFSNELKKRIGVMRDIEGLYTKMTGYEYLRFVATLYEYPVDKIDERIDYLAKKYNIENEIDRQIKKYSAGTKKKLEFCAAVLHEAGVPISIITDAPVIPLQYLPMCAGLAMEAGLDEETAWHAITINPAVQTGIGERVGSLEPGKDADIVIWTANPLTTVGAEAYTTIVDGKVVYQQ